MKLSESLKINAENIRIREFTMAGQKLRVRVPLSSEMDEINKKVELTDWSHKRKEMIEPMLVKKEELASDKIIFEDDDVIFDGKSMKALAKATAQTETRITEMVKLLIPAQEGVDMSGITYEEINSEFPFPIQLELMKKIIEVISPSYEETRKKLIGSLRLQARAYMLAHGANPDAMGEDDYHLVMVALNDGLFGNKSLLNTMGSLTAGVFNYIRSANSQAYKLKDIIGSSYDYIYKPLTKEQKEADKNEKLLTFISMMPGANVNLKND